jgi:hypothetical protein
MNYRCIDRTNPTARVLPSPVNAVVVSFAVMHISHPSSRIFLSGDPLGLHDQEDFSLPLQRLVHQLSRFQCGSPARQQLIVGVDRIRSPRTNVTTRPSHVRSLVTTFRDEVSGSLHLIIESRLQTDERAELSSELVGRLGADPFGEIRFSASIIAGV